MRWETGDSTQLKSGLNESGGVETGIQLGVVLSLMPEIIYYCTILQLYFHKLIYYSIRPGTGKIIPIGDNCKTTFNK